MLPVPQTPISFADDPPPPLVPLVEPSEPLPLPGSHARERLMATRVTAREPTTQAGDVLSAPGQVGFGRRLRNGYHRKEAEVVQEDFPGQKMVRAPLSRDGIEATGRVVFFGKRLRDLRRLRGLSLGQVRDRTGLPRSTIDGIERQGRDLQVSTAWLLADCYGVTIDELVGRA